MGTVEGTTTGAIDWTVDKTFKSSGHFNFITQLQLVFE